MPYGIHDYRLFILTAVVLVLTPGQDTLFILGRSLAAGRGAGIASALGISAGSLVHTLAAALGLSAILSSSALAFTFIKLMGAAYLAYLGLRMMLLRARPLPAQNSSQVVGAWMSFRQGMITNVLNPKVALFFLALMPQFISADSEHKVAAFLVLGGTFVLMGTLWCLTIAVCAAGLRSRLNSKATLSAWFNRLAGALFIALAARLATTRSAP